VHSIRSVFYLYCPKKICTFFYTKTATLTNYISSRDAIWYPLHLTSMDELCLDKTLRCGQSFRWKKKEPDSWFGVIGSTVIGFKEVVTRNDIFFCFFPEISLPEVDHPKSNGVNFERRDIEVEKIRKKLIDYFRLDISLASLYEQWALGDEHFREVSMEFKGIRLLKQDPVECLFSFICSQNNNISRITKMIG